jgi:hypothetical protein
MIPVKDVIRIQDKINQGNIFYYLVSSSQNPQSSHNHNMYSLLRMEQITHSSFENPQDYHTWAATQPL